VVEKSLPYDHCTACSRDSHPVGKTPDSIYPKVSNAVSDFKVDILKLSDIFKEGSDARKLFGKFYAVGAIAVILAVLALLALATRGG
jgi:hypothetical protein